MVWMELCGTGFDGSVLYGFGEDAGVGDESFVFVSREYGVSRL